MQLEVLGDPELISSVCTGVCGEGGALFEVFLCYQTLSLSIGIWTDGLLGEMFCFCSP